jgi:hypothetical protein
MQHLGHVAEMLVEPRAGQARDQPELLARIDQVASRLARRVERDVEDEEQADRQCHGQQPRLDAEAQALRAREVGHGEGTQSAAGSPRLRCWALAAALWGRTAGANVA